jgi:uncharacterized lipoprotein YmbA
VSYYTLIPPAVASNAETANACCVIEIRSVRIPSQVDRSELVIRRSDEQFDVLSNDLWVAPLRDEVRGALLNDIRGKLPRGRSVRGERARKFVVFVDVSRFESEPARYALIEAEWRVEPAEGPKSAAPVCKTLAQVHVAGGVSGVVQGYQQAISTIASSITVTLLDAQQGGALDCPSPQPAT